MKKIILLFILFSLSFTPYLYCGATGFDAAREEAVGKFNRENDEYQERVEKRWDDYAQEQEKIKEQQRILQTQQNQQAMYNLGQMIKNDISQRQLQEVQNKPKPQQFQFQRQQLLSDYNAGNISSADYYNALANIDRNEQAYNQAQQQQRQFYQAQEAQRQRDFADRVNNPPQYQKGGQFNPVHVRIDD
jgi:hypothetical protein